MISLKKYLDLDAADFRSPDSDEGELLNAALMSYRCALLDMGKSGYRSCPAFGSGLQQELSRLEGRLAGEVTVPVLQQTSENVTRQLSLWAELTEDHFKVKAQEVKDLLIVLARTAESVGERDQRYAEQLHQFTSRLRTVADLEDLTQIRSSLMQKAVELKTCVDQMEQESQKAISQLQARVASCESRLKESEDLALRDALTGLPNRLQLERSMDWRIENQTPFCVLFLDLNQFKLINDRHGHTAGDDLLKQFSVELRSNLRPADVVGRWSGDEFVILIDSELAGAAVITDRLRQWVFGDYTISSNTTKSKAKVRVDAAIGVAEWAVGETHQQLIERADLAMYREKRSPPQWRKEYPVEAGLRSELSA